MNTLCYEALRVPAQVQIRSTKHCVPPETLDRVLDGDVLKFVDLTN